MLGGRHPSERVLLGAAAARLQAPVLTGAHSVSAEGDDVVVAHSVFGGIAEETVAARPALASEAERLNIRPGAIVLTIARIYRTDERAVETADIIIPVERYALVYDVPVG